VLLLRRYYAVQYLAVGDSDGERQRYRERGRGIRNAQDLKSPASCCHWTSPARRRRPSPSECSQFQPVAGHPVSLVTLQWSGLPVRLPVCLSLCPSLPSSGTCAALLHCTHLFVAAWVG
jgi:hypothetical protein